MRQLLQVSRILHFAPKCSSTYTWYKELSSLHNGMVPGVDDVCRVLSGPWGPDLEKELSSLHEEPQVELVNGVLRMLKDVNLAMNYFRWVEKNSGKAHSSVAYDVLLKMMARSKKFYGFEQIWEEMSIAGYELSDNTCIQLVASCANSGWLKEAFGLIEAMRKFKFRPAFSAYTTLIGSFAGAREPGPSLNLFHQMQEVGYEVNMQLLTTLIRVFAREGQVDAALSLREEMKSHAFEADIVLYNVCIDCFGKAGKVDMA
ncbi:hypothetical protein ACHQM5_018409 [Ranunculus cassubicifolius]